MFGRELNAYFWVPQKKDYGDLCFTATPHACVKLKERIDLILSGEIPRANFCLPGVTERDVRCVGGGLDYGFTSLRIELSGDDFDLPQYDLDRAQRRVVLKLSEHTSALFFKLVEEVRRGHGDVSTSAIVNGKQKSFFHWPCFGHLWKFKDPEMRFDE